MRRPSLRVLCLFAAALLTPLAGCMRLPPRQAPRTAPARPAPKDYYRPLPAGEHALRKLDPSQVPPLSTACADTGELLATARRSLAYLAKPSSQQFFPVSGITHDHVVRSLEALVELLEQGVTGDALAAELSERFDVYSSVGCDGAGTVLFTGYYTPIFEASRERTATFCFPLHRPPEGHVKDPLTGETKGLRRADGTIDPDYPGREELLDSGLLEGRELVWLANPFEPYIIGVQGSAMLRLQDGSHLEVGYAGTNGKEYRSIGKALIDAGRLKREELNLRNLIRIFDEDPGLFAHYSALNERYVFFEEGDGGPYGCLNEKVTAGRTIATDKTIFPRGALCLIEAPLPTGAADPDGAVRAFAFDQDAGGAIRAPGRCDVYMGIGDEAGEVAGRTLSEGRLYYLLLKDEAGFAYRSPNRGAAGGGRCGPAAWKRSCASGCQHTSSPTPSAPPPRRRTTVVRRLQPGPASTARPSSA